MTAKALFEWARYPHAFQRPRGLRDTGYRGPWPAHTRIAGLYGGCDKSSWLPLEPVLWKEPLGHCFPSGLQFLEPLLFVAHSALSHEPLSAAGSLLWGV